MMQSRYQNNTLQDLKRQRALFIWKELMPQGGLLFLGLLVLLVRSHFFLFMLLLSPLQSLSQKLKALSKLNREIKQHIAQSGFRIQDEYPPRMV